VIWVNPPLKIVAERDRRAREARGRPKGSRGCEGKQAQPGHWPSKALVSRAGEKTGGAGAQRRRQKGFEAREARPTAKRSGAGWACRAGGETSRGVAGRPLEGDGSPPLRRQTAGLPEQAKKTIAAQAK